MTNSVNDLHTLRIKYDPQKLYNYDKQLGFNFTDFCNKIEEVTSSEEEQPTATNKNHKEKKEKKKKKKKTQNRRKLDSSGKLTTEDEDIPSLYSIIAKHIGVNENPQPVHTKNNTKGTKHDGTGVNALPPAYTIEDMKPNAIDYKVFAEITNLCQRTDLNSIDVYQNKLSEAPTSGNTNSLQQLYKIWLQNSLIDSWYISPYPVDNERKRLSLTGGSAQCILYVCEYCFQYTLDKYKHHRHALKCREPFAGECIYNDTENGIQVYEMDGLDEVNRSRNLCLFSKLFLNSKTLYYDVEPFLFYIFYHNNQFVGYFSKEKVSANNLSCILTNPILHKQQWGQFIIHFSYLLSSISACHGSPEKPLSDLGLLSYRKYWKFQTLTILIDLFKQLSPENNTTTLKVSLKELSTLTGMISTDVVFGMEQLQVLYQSDKGKTFKIDLNVAEWETNEKYIHWKKTISKMNGLKYLNWKPPLLGPSGGINTQVITSWVGSNKFWVKDYVAQYMNDSANCSTLYAERENLVKQLVLQKRDSTNMQSDQQWELCYVEYNKSVVLKDNLVVTSTLAAEIMLDDTIDEEVLQVLTEPLSDADIEDSEDQSFDEKDIEENDDDDEAEDGSTDSESYNSEDSDSDEVQAIPRVIRNTRSLRHTEVTRPSRRERSKRVPNKRRS